MFYNWLAGVIDGDGCFCFSIRKQHNSKIPAIVVWSQVSISAKIEDKWYLEYIKKNIGFGSVYEKKLGSPQGYQTCEYQTTNYKDSLHLAELVYPYLVLKKNKCRLFIEALKKWINSTRRKAGRSSGLRERTATEVLEMLKVACQINADRNSRRYKDKLTYEEWEPLIKKWYND